MIVGDHIVRKNQLGNMEITAKDAAMKKAALQQRLAQITPQTIAEQTNAPSPLDIQINDMKAKRDTLLTHLNAVPIEGLSLVLKRAADGSTAEVTLHEGPIYPTFDQFGPVD